MMKTTVPTMRRVLCCSLTRSYQMACGRSWEPCFQDCPESASPLFFLSQQLSQVVKQSLSYWSLRSWHPHAHESVVGETVIPNGWDHETTCRDTVGRVRFVLTSVPLVLPAVHENNTEQAQADAPYTGLSPSSGTLSLQKPQSYKEIEAILLNIPPWGRPSLIILKVSKFPLQINAFLPGISLGREAILWEGACLLKHSKIGILPQNMCRKARTWSITQYHLLKSGCDDTMWLTLSAWGHGLREWGRVSKAHGTGQPWKFWLLLS